MAIRAMTRTTAISLMLLCIAPTVAIGQYARHWIPVPGHKNVYVDLASIQHFRSQHIGGPSNMVPTPDTSVDVKIGQRVEDGVSLWCKGRFVFGDAHEQYTDLNGKTV